MAALCSLPGSPDLSALRATLQDLLGFLRAALPICSAHTVDFYTESLWRELVDLSPDGVLAALGAPAGAEPREAGPGPGLIDLPRVFCERSQKLLSTEAFALAARHYSVQSLGLCTPFEQLLTALGVNKEQRTDTCENVKAIEFMNTKKSHEVQAMSELICSIADYCGLKQIIDVGSGKGYLSSFLSLKYGLNVYGIDSSNTNTHGAKERNRKLRRHCKLNHRQTRVDASGAALKMPKAVETQKEAECKGGVESAPKSSLGSQNMAADVLPEVSESAVSVIGKQQDLHAQPREEDKFCLENAFSLMDLLPVDAIEPTSPQVHNTEMSEVGKQRRDMKSKPNDSSVYSPLTSFITADSELHDIITDLEDCLMVGLHTCGDLASNTLRIFASKSEVKGVCSVGCCYHLLSEEFENQPKEYAQENWGFPMCRYLKEERWCCGRNARMSACLALERVAVGQGVSEEIIMDYYEKYKPRMNELEAFNMLKVVLAPCIETLILLDRLCYLKEQEDVAWCALVKLFDPVQSPRCYGVIALKKQSDQS
ncbi:probable methyltransferase-like protein 25 isoform X2 [Phodopus roborovskii]|uniref:probable methyltransferase-like protein 25 isoform X2 n=1 Tax=Phodopus roborovskii TaxID=109678 RepID=UPI0021E41DE4|nr:probable methyltransferase-like protein 25 isoform X2 [Phodopus roborovskii]